MKKKKFFAPLLGALVLGLSAYAGYRTYSAYNGVSESDLLLANAEALAGPDEGSYEYPDGYAYSSTCNVVISKWRRCKVEVITCQGGGNGCNSKDCPTHS